MDFKELDYLITLADEKNISRAAERLFMAQSSLSHFIRQLESELGTTLFIRTPRGIIPTASGEQFLVHARHMLQEFHIAKNELCELNHLVKGTIQFGISTYRGVYLLPDILRRFHTQYPGISVSITEKTSRQLEYEILNGNLDMALLSLPFTVLKEEDIILRRADEVKLICSPDHPILKIAEKDPKSGIVGIPLSAIGNYTFVFSPPDMALCYTARKLFRDYNIHPIAYPTELSPLLATAVVRSENALAFSSAALSHLAPELIYLPLLPGKHNIELGIVFSQKGATSKACQIFGKYFVE